jgi:hypothetical protein
MSRTPAASVASSSGQKSRELGVPWNRITGVPCRSPHSQKARVRPSRSWIVRSVFGVAVALVMRRSVGVEQLEHRSHCLESGQRARPEQDLDLAEAARVERPQCLGYLFR